MLQSLTKKLLLQKSKWMNNNEKYKSLVKKIRAKQDGPTADLLEKMGISYSMIFGLSIMQLKQLALPYKSDDSFAEFLWGKDIRETKLIALMIFNPENLKDSEIDNIITGFSNAEMVEQAVMHFLTGIKNAFNKSAEYCQNENEFVKMTGYTLLARLSMKAYDINNNDIGKFFQFIIDDAETNSIHVKKAISFALRKTGLINDKLREQAIQVCKELESRKNNAAKWIASDAMIELEYI